MNTRRTWVSLYWARAVGVPVRVEAFDEVEARLDAVRQEADRYYLPVDVRNRGNRTAQDVQVQAELDTGSGAPESAEFTIMYLAGGDEMQGTFIFGDDPRQGELTVEVTSYQEP